MHEAIEEMIFIHKKLHYIFYFWKQRKFLLSGSQDTHDKVQLIVLRTLSSISLLMLHQLNSIKNILVLSHLRREPSYRSWGNTYEDSKFWLVRIVIDRRFMNRQSTYSKYKLTYFYFKVKFMIKFDDLWWESIQMISG